MLPLTTVAPGGHDLLSVRLSAGKQSTFLLPFVKAIVPVVDIAAGRLVIDPPEGLIELNAEFVLAPQRPLATGEGRALEE